MSVEIYTEIYHRYKSNISDYFVKLQSLLVKYDIYCR